MSGPIDFVAVAIGTRLEMSDGSFVEVVDNPRDGMWLICRRVLADGVLSETEETVFVYDVA
ncbi:MAG TPA: hypothetical protein VEX68_15660 [Bryobacteraceae bacterium]|nr:hypothetical protein [Bryobacteraceae bacterium]